MSEQTSPTLETVGTARVAVVSGTDVPVADVRTFFDSGFGTLADALQQQGAEPTGPAFARYAREPGDTMDVEVGFPVGPAVEATDAVQVTELPGGPAARLVHEGAYDDLGTSWERLVSWARDQGATPLGWFYEEYLTEPTPGADPADMRTRLTLPLQES
ncbi:GyrI-like domain-containing protein [Serinicoccus kebangsaanensis]|uniref:GyrI-like domain-containing protein n=1 Tax=Serinicoccus kebangsaanensis TaxID=2602069 RepID=UPI00178C4949|nr:GyrI-like domain-containing protein [Serinicoccus kebangsaanensis]